MKCPIVRKQTLQQRLVCLTGRNVEIQARELSLEPGKLQKVCRKLWIRVQNELFVPTSLYSIRVPGIGRRGTYRRVGVRTAFDAQGAYDDVYLVQTGKDFIELQTNPTSGSRILLPLRQVVGIYSIQ